MSTSSSVSVAASPLPPSTLPPAASATALADVLTQVEATVGYLRCSTTTVPGTTAGLEPVEWLSCAELIAEPRRLADVIRSTMPGRGTHQESVAVSLFVQSYAFRIGALVLAPYALGLPVPSCSPAHTFVRLTRHRPGGVAVTDPAVNDRSVDQLVGALLGQHLAPLIASTSSVVTIGRRLLWGNVAASCATVFRAIEGADGVDAVAVRRRAEAFLAAADSWLKGLGWFEVLPPGPAPGADQWRWQRTNCCLYYQCSGASKCDDCSLDRILAQPTSTVAATVSA